MVCARERRLLPYDRIEEEEDGVEGLRCCLNTGARAGLLKCQQNLF